MKAIPTLAPALLIALTGCGSAPPPGGAPASPAPVFTSAPFDTARAWPIRSVEHIDLWFHGFAMLTGDTARLPYFTRGYREQMILLKRQRNVQTSLDANREALSARFVSNPGLNNAQFAIFHYSSFEDLARAVEALLRAEGSPGAIPDPVMRQKAAPLAQSFRSVADRDWLRLFMQAMTDERARFYGPYWSSERDARNAALHALETMWATKYRARFARFLANSRLGDGTFIVSMPLNGEGRSVNGPEGNAVAVSFPSTADRAIDAIYAFAHEIVLTASQLGVQDNLTPAQARAGEADRYMPVAPVRGGALLLERISPEDVAGYMRYYLRSAGAAVPTGDPASAFATAFPLPSAIVEGIRRQIATVLGGI
jgi:hypothetical protein